MEQSTPAALLQRVGGAQSPQSQMQYDTWTIPPTDRAAYDALFHTVASPTSSLLGGESAKAFFVQSGLPAPVLAAVWGLSDLDRDGFLDRDEFAVAMHLCRRARKGDQIPSVLPRQLVPQSKCAFYNVTANSASEWATFTESPHLAVIGGGSGVEFVSDMRIPEPKSVSPAVAAPSGAFTGNANASTAQSASKDGSMLPRFALPGASFEQRMALEGELGSAIQRRNPKQ